MADTPLPHDLLRAITRQLIEDNARACRRPIEQGLIDLMATIQIGKRQPGEPGSAARPQASFPEPRMRAWAKLQMLATQGEFSGKLRVYLNNLQQGGDEDLASRNAFGMPLAQLNQRAAPILRGRHNSRPCSPPALPSIPIAISITASWPSPI